MEEKYINLIKSFKTLDDEYKKEEILRNIYELLNLLHYINNKTNKFNNNLTLLNRIEKDSEYFDTLFSYIILLKEENAMLLKNINKN